jgi:RNA-directed DNA polymerase
MMNLIKKYKEWNRIEWGEVHTNVFNSQTKIYKQTKSGNMNKVRYYQRKPVSSPFARLLALRTVTQDNRGKKNCWYRRNIRVITDSKISTR